MSRWGGSPGLKSANLMLDEPPLIVRMRPLDGFMDNSSIILQTDQKCAAVRRRQKSQPSVSETVTEDHFD